MLGILNEKPSQACNFAAALFGGKYIQMAKDAKGIRSAKGTYKGQEVVIVASHGHLYQYKDPNEMVNKTLAAKYKSWDPKYLPWNQNDFSWEYKIGKGNSAWARSIRNLLAPCDEIVIASDDDPSGEGEKLAWEILIMQKLHPKKFSRAYFSDEHDVNDVRQSIDHRAPKTTWDKDPDMMEAELRARRDFISMQWTRLATHAVGNHAVLRQGRLKSTMVSVVFDQFEKIKHYKKIPAYSQRFKDENGNVFSKKDAETFPNQDQVKLDGPGKVKILKKSVKYAKPPKYYNLTDLGIAVASKGITAAQVLKTYQAMYEKGIVSYPRTEDKAITHDMFNKILPNVDKIAKLVGVDPKLLSNRVPRKGFVDDKAGAHGANRPGQTIPKTLNDLVQYGPGAVDIYKTLALNYLATLAPDYEYEQVDGCVDNNPDYVGSTRQTKDLGWHKVYGTTPSNSQPFGKIAKPFIYTGYPPKPSQPTMKWLFTQLSKHEIGTGATQMSTYQDVTNPRSKYPLLNDKRGKITLTKYGEWSAEIMRGTKMADVKLTEEWTKDMKTVRKGKAGWDQINKWLDEEADLVASDAKIIKQNSISFRKVNNITMNDEEDRIEGQWTDEDGEVNDVRLKKTWRGHTWTDDEAKQLFAGKDVKVKLTKKDGTGQYEMLASLGHRSFTDSQGKVIKGIWVDGKFAPRKKDVPDEWHGHKFTDEEKETLRNHGKVHATFTWKSGKQSDCDVTWGEHEWNGKTIVGIIPQFK